MHLTRARASVRVRLGVRACAYMCILRNVMDIPQTCDIKWTQHVLDKCACQRARATGRVGLCVHVHISYG